MSGSVNKVILIGNLGKDPEVRHTASGSAVCNFSIATAEKWKDKGGNANERTEWHKIVAWGKLAELCGEYLSKGRQVFVEGKLQTNDWEDKEGNKRTQAEVFANSVVFLGGGESRQSRSDDRGNQQSFGGKGFENERSYGGSDDAPW